MTNFTVTGDWTSQGTVAGNVTFTPSTGAAVTRATISNGTLSASVPCISGTYVVSFSQVSLDGLAGIIRPFSIPSPSNSATVPLNSVVAPAPNVIIVGGAVANNIPPATLVVSTNISDATETGIDLLTAPSENAALAQLGGKRSPVQITDNCFAVPQGTGTFSGTFRFPYHVGISACDLQLVFANFTVSGSPLTDVDATTTLTFTAAIEDASGAIFPVTSGGNRTMTLGAAAILTTDPASIDVNQGDTIHVRVFVSSGTYQSTKAYTGITGGGGVTATTDLTASGSAAISDAATQGFGPGPIAIVGIPTAEGGTPPAVVELGDSICSTSDGPLALLGGYSPTSTYLTGGGFVLRSITGSAGFINASITGDEIQWFASNASHVRRASIIKYARYAFIEYGTNDLGVGRTAAQLQANLLTLATMNKARGVVKNIVMTLLPNSSSTDGWMTLGNQTPNATKLTTRVTHNNWVRDGGPIDPSSLAPVATGTAGALRFGDVGHPIDAYLEVADVVESSRDSGLWKVSGRSVHDAAATASSNTITSATANFTNADVGAALFIAGADTGSANYIKNVINVVSNSTTVTLATAGGAGSYPKTTVTGALMTIGALTGDGLHPNATGHAYIANAVQAELLALLD